MLMDKIAKLISDEPRIHPVVSVRLLWSLYAMDYAEKPTLLKLQENAVRELSGMTTSQIKSLFKIMAHFDYFSYPAKETLEGHVVA